MNVRRNQEVVIHYLKDQVRRLEEEKRRAEEIKKEIIKRDVELAKRKKEEEEKAKREKAPSPIRKVSPVTLPEPVAPVKKVRRRKKVVVYETEDEESD